MRAVSFSGRGIGRMRAITSGATSISPAQALITTLQPYASLILLADVGTLQGDGTAAVAGDALTAATATWQDQSGNGRHATQATVMSEPALIAGAINGRSALRFDGLDDLLNLTWPGAAAASLFTVCRRLTPGSQGAGLCKFSGASYYGYGNLIFECFGSDTRRDGISPPAGVALTDWHLFEVSASATEWTAYLDGQIILTTGTNHVSFLPAQTIGYNGESPNNGDIGAVVIANPTHREAIRALLLSYYGLP